MEGATPFSAQIKETILNDTHSSSTDLYGNVVIQKLNKRHKYILHYYEDYKRVRKHFKWYYDVGFLDRWSKEDYDYYTVMGQMKDSQLLSCCESKEPYAWRIHFSNDPLTIYYHALCRKHTIEHCSLSISAYNKKCQCGEHTSTTVHDKCCAWRSIGICGAFSSIIPEYSFPEKMIKANFKIKNMPYEKSIKCLGQIRWLSVEEQQAQLKNPSMYKCAILCYHTGGNWCKKDGVATIRFEWEQQEIEQTYCIEHIQNHCRKIRATFPQAPCYCCIDSDDTMKTCTSK